MHGAAAVGERVVHDIREGGFADARLARHEYRDRGSLGGGLRGGDRQDRGDEQVVVELFGQAKRGRTLVRRHVAVSIGVPCCGRRCAPRTRFPTSPGVGG